jgi:hypothetical protein
VVAPNTAAGSNRTIDSSRWRSGHRHHRAERGDLENALAEVRRRLLAEDSLGSGREILLSFGLIGSRT